jgi:hypothetical protein
MLRKALIPLLVVLAVVIALAVIEYGCTETGFEEKVLGPEQEHHHH